MLLAACLPAPKTGACLHAFAPTPTAQAAGSGTRSPAPEMVQACTARLCIELHACQQLLVGHRDLVSSRVAMACGGLM